jgi:DNA-binding winged helix-turn-helix (wHTH) protein
MLMQATGNTLIVGDWLVEPMCTRIQKDGCFRPVQPLSMDILVHLAERAGEVVGTTELLDLFWPDRYVGSDAVHRRIANLRSALEDDTAKPRYIETIRKRGYRLIAPVRCRSPEVLPVNGLLDAFGDHEDLELEFELRSGRRVFARGTLSLEGTSRK